MDALTQVQNSDFTNTVGGKIFLAAAGALFSLAATLYINRRISKRERRLLTWSQVVESQALDVSGEIREKVEVRYSGMAVKDLTIVHYAITNDGIKGIRDNQFRFPFPESANVVEFYPQPAPEPEQGFEDLSQDDDHNERVVKVGYLQPGGSIQFLIVATGNADWNNWSGVRSSNPVEDVEFERKDAARAAEDREHIRPFAFWGIVLILAPGIVSGLYNFGAGNLFGAAAGAIFFMLFILFFVPRIAPISRIIEAIVTSKMKDLDRRDEITVINADESVIVTSPTSNATDGIKIYSPNAK